MLLIGGSIVLRRQRNRQRFALATKAIDAGLPMPHAPPSWLASRRQAISIGTPGVGPIVVGIGAWSTGAATPTPTNDAPTTQPTAPAADVGSMFGRPPAPPRMTRSQNLSPKIAVALATIAAPVACVVAQNNTSFAQTAQAPAATPLGGTVKAYDLNPQGDADGLLVDVGGGRTTQVNFPPTASTMIGQAVGVGDAIKLTAEARPTRSGVTIHDLVTLTGKDGKQMRLAPPGDEAKSHVEGTVASLSYAREGEVHAAALEDGTFVHVGPREAADLKLAVGQKPVVDGTKTPTRSGRAVIATRRTSTAPRSSDPRPARMTRWPRRRRRRSGRVSVETRNAPGSIPGRFRVRDRSRNARTHPAVLP